MKYVLLKVHPEVSHGDIVIYDPSASMWVKSNSAEGLLGVISGAVSEEDGEFTAYVRFKGEVEVVAGQQIPAEGGALAVSDGKAFVNGSVSSLNRYILPNETAVGSGAFCVIGL